MKKLPFCRECKFYGGAGKCKHPEHPIEKPHIRADFWCLLGEFRGKGDFE